MKLNRKQLKKILFEVMTQKLKKQKNKDIQKESTDYNEDIEEGFFEEELNEEDYDFDINEEDVDTFFKSIYEKKKKKG